MIQIKYVENFNASDICKTNLRRGFVIPITGTFDKVLAVVDSDTAIDHEYIADDFIKLSDENLNKVLLASNLTITEANYDKALWMCKKVISNYKQMKDEYPTSRKDYLIYENGAVAFDQKPGYSLKYILYRNSGNGYTIPQSTDRVACSFLMAGFKEEYAPEDHKAAGPTFY